jgi:YHS domain-containing protein
MTLAAATLYGPLAADEADSNGRTPETRQSAKEALAEFNPLIGGWRGVGQPRRNSSVGAWTETAEWVWEFKDDSVGIRYEVKDGNLLETALLTWDPQTEVFRLHARFTDEVEREYQGRLDDRRLVLESEPDDEQLVHRITITQLNEKRTLVLHERRRAAQSFYSRVAEVGYTREGTSLAVEGTGGPECIVTGGLATIPVTHKGETYYVCCTGCQQAFEDDPEGILAEYREKQAEPGKK